MKNRNRNQGHEYVISVTKSKCLFPQYYTLSSHRTTTYESQIQKNKSAQHSVIEVWKMKTGCGIFRVKLWYLSPSLRFSTSSGIKKLFCGVPQGPWLGHFLVLLYINYIPNISKRLNFSSLLMATITFFESKNKTSRKIPNNYQQGAGNFVQCIQTCFKRC